MSDDFEPFATAGSGKSDPEVAFDLLNKLKGQGVWGERNLSAILDMYAECLDAVKGYRAYEGQNRVIAPTREMKPVSQQTQIPQPAPQMTPPQPTARAPHPGHSAPQPSAQANPVQSQQHQIQQSLQNRG